MSELAEREQMILTLSENGFGKRSSSHEYRVSGRGGKGIAAMVVNERNGELVSAFPVEDDDQIMLVTDGGQLIRCPVTGYPPGRSFNPRRYCLQDRPRTRRSFPSSISVRAKMRKTLTSKQAHRQR